MECIVSLNRLYDTGYRIQDTGYNSSSNNNSNSNSNSNSYASAQQQQRQRYTTAIQLRPYGLCKKPKKWGCGFGFGTPPYRSASVSLSGVIARAAIQPKHYGYLIFFIIFVSKQIIMRKIFNVSPSLMGYDMKDGRMVRTAPCPEMGLTKLANLNKEMKRAKKIDMIAEGVRLGNL